MTDGTAVGAVRIRTDHVHTLPTWQRAKALHFRLVQLSFLNPFQAEERTALY